MKAITFAILAIVAQQDSVPDTDGVTIGHLVAKVAQAFFVIMAIIFAFFGE